MEQKAEPPFENDAIDEKIKAVNDTSISGALISAFCIATVITICSRLSGILCFIVSFSISFVFMYQTLFYCFGKELIAEAKKRNKYLIKESYVEKNSDCDHPIDMTHHGSNTDIVKYDQYDAINISNGNPPGLGYIGPIRNRD